MARDFDGVDDQLQSGLPVSTFFSATTGTMTAWCFPAGAAPSQFNVYQLPAVVADFAAFVGIHRGITDGANNLWAYNWDGNADRVGLSYTQDAWNFVGWVHSAGTLFVYVNDSTASVASGTTDTMTGEVRIARGGFGSTQFLGRIAQVQLWNIALSATEIEIVRRGGIVRPESRTGAYDIFGVSSPEPDWSGNNRHLTVTGAVRIDHPPGIGAYWRGQDIRQVKILVPPLPAARHRGGAVEHDLRQFTAPFSESVPSPRRSRRFRRRAR